MAIETEAERREECGTKRKKDNIYILQILKTQKYNVPIELLGRLQSSGKSMLSIGKIAEKWKALAPPVEWKKNPAGWLS